MNQTKKRILIVGSTSPLRGREELGWTQVVADALRQREDVQVDMFMLPIVQDPLLLPEQMFAFRLLDVENSCDLLIAIGYPAFAIKHPHKRVLLFCLAPHLHEWFNSEYGALATPQYERIRQAVTRAERQCLAEAERILCASSTLASYLKLVHKLKSTSMMIYSGSRFENRGDRTNSDGFRLVCESTLEPFERIDLILSALVLVQKPCQLEIFIPSASDVYYHALHERIKRLQLNERVVTKREALPCSELSTSSACVVLPFASTRISDVVARAIMCNVPLISTRDSGAVLEVVKHKKNGLVVEPSAPAVARAIDSLIVNAKLRDQLSQRSQHFADRFSDIDAVVKGLVE